MIKLSQMKKLNQSGFIPMLLAMLAIIVALILFVFMRVKNARP